MKHYFTVTFKTTCGIINWAVLAENEEEAKTKAAEDIKREFEIGGYKIQAVKEENKEGENG